MVCQLGLKVSPSRPNSCPPVPAPPLTSFAWAVRSMKLAASVPFAETTRICPDNWVMKKRAGSPGACVIATGWLNAFPPSAGASATDVCVEGRAGAMQVADGPG